MKLLNLYASAIALLALAKDDNPESFAGKVTIGIDLGTTYSCVGIVSGGNIQILENELGKRITPSYVGWDEQGNELVGDEAKNQATIFPLKTIFDAKRLIGRGYYDKSVQEDIKHLPFRIVDNKGRINIKVEKKPGVEETFIPEQISAKVLAKLKSIADDHLPEPSTHAIITVPAYFTNSQRVATQQAAKLAGFTFTRVINEPTAAALAHSHKNRVKADEERLVLVYDLGGGTFDVSLIEQADGINDVKGVGGNSHLGGEDFDQNTMKVVKQEIKQRYKVDLDNMKCGDCLQRLRQECERAKRDLSTVTETEIDLSDILGELADKNPDADPIYTFTRAKFEEINNDLFESTITAVKKVLADTKTNVSDIKEILMVGGSTRIPKIQQLLKKFFNGKEPNRGINPDEAVAYGAAVQASIVSGQNTGTDILLVDVTPLSVGIETAGGIFTPVVPKGTTIPATKKQVFSTYDDNQTGVTIKVFEGERTLTKHNIVLGEFNLNGIPPAPRGVPQIEVEFQIDNNGILNVSATDLGTKKKGNIAIRNDRSVHDAETVERLIAEAEKHREEDIKHKARVDALNYADRLIAQCRNFANLDSFNKLSSEKQYDYKKHIDEFEQWINDNRHDASAEEITEKSNAFSATTGDIGKQIYETSNDSTDDSDDKSDTKDEL